MNQYQSTKRAVLVHITHRQSNPCNPYIRSLLRIGIKVMDEWQIRLDYVRGSNIYVRGYLGLRTWSLRLRTQIRKFHYVKALFSSREGDFSLRLIKRNTRDKAKSLLDLFGETYRGAGQAMLQQNKQRQGSKATVQTISHAPSPHHPPPSYSAQWRYNGEHSLKRKSDL